MDVVLVVVVDKRAGRDRDRDGERDRDRDGEKDATGTEKATATGTEKAKATGTEAKAGRDRDKEQVKTAPAKLRGAGHAEHISLYHAEV